MACTASGTSPCPVINSTGSSLSRPCSCSSSCRPSMPGIRISLTTTPGQSVGMRSARPWASASATTLSPARSSVWLRAWRRCASSSTRITWARLSISVSGLMPKNPLNWARWHPAGLHAFSRSAPHRPRGGWPATVLLPGCASGCHRWPGPSPAPGCGSWW